ncbi:MAG TPA: DUF58 domain-containing protein [Trebonia sp.]|nr:DUF58 domain-containing protein [Trebonia sp.]
MALSGRAFAVALLAVLVVLAVRSAVTIAVIDGLLLTAIVADVLLAVPVSELRVTRAGDTRVRLGEQATVITTVVNTGRRPLNAQVRDAWPPSARARPYRAVLQVPPGGSGDLIMTVSPERQGDCAADRVTIRSFGPLGLAARQRGQLLPWTVRALPPFPSRKHLPGKLAHLRELDGQHRAALPGAGSEFDSLREYVIGDDVRSVDWRSTARRGEVLVRTWRPERDRRIVFLLDTGRAAAGRVAGYPRLDAAMDAVQLLTALASQAGDRIDLIAVDQRIRSRVLAPARTTALATVTGAMATLRPELAETDWRLAAATVLALARRRCLVVLLTDLNPALALPELGALLARHELLIGAVTDPRITELAAGREDAASVYAAAAATHFAEERVRLTAQLNRLGATVVDAPPDRIAPALADAYLTLKSRGRL